MTTRFAISVVSLTVCSAALLSACGSSESAAHAPTVPTQQPALTTEQSRAVADAQKQTNGGNIGIDEEILRLCPAVKPAYFGYDSANVRQRFSDSLVAIADCMKNGPLKDRKLLLVGHADPRGEPDYNVALGGRRADSVRQAIGAFGARIDAMDITSRGEVDARGTDDASWANDRRVDIKLQGGGG